MVQNNNLPDELESCHAVIEELVGVLRQRDRRISQLEHRLDLLLRARYGRSSEKLDPNQALLFDPTPEEVEATPEQEPEEEDLETATIRKGHGRRRIPKELERRRIEHDIPEAEKKCPDCGCLRVRIGEEKSEQLDYIPASIFVVEHVRYKYACKHCEGRVIVADKDRQPIEKGLAAPGLLAQVIVSKYSDHLPLNRQVDILARNGIEISKTTQWGWISSSAKVLEQLYKLMESKVLKSKAIHTDDTTLPTLDDELDKTKTGRMWVYLGDKNHPYTIYKYTENRSREGPAEFLKGYRGYLQADAYRGYDGIYADGKILEVACWAHARRKFFEAQTSQPGESVTALGYIKRLYNVERSASYSTAEKRLDLRRTLSLPRLESFKKWLLKQKENVLPKSPFGAAVEYTLNNWEALCRYTEDGDLSIDNNPAERALRPVVVGRKNWLFVGSPQGGHTAAILYSIVMSCKRHNIDPFRYIREVLTRLPDHSMPHLEDLLPDRIYTPIPEPDSSHSS